MRNKHIEQAITISPNDLSLQETYGVILASNKKFVEAIAVLSEALENGSSETNAQVSLVEAYIATAQPDKAKQLLNGLSSHDSMLNIKIAKLKQELAKGK